MCVRPKRGKCVRRRAFLCIAGGGKMVSWKFIFVAVAVASFFSLGGPRRLEAAASSLLEATAAGIRSASVEYSRSAKESARAFVEHCQTMTAADLLADPEAARECATWKARGVAFLEESGAYCGSSPGDTEGVTWRCEERTQDDRLETSSDLFGLARSVLGYTVVALGGFALAAHVSGASWARAPRRA